MQLQKHKDQTSEITFKVIALKQLSFIKTNANFWKEHYDQDHINELFKNNFNECWNKIEQLKIYFNDNNFSAVSIFDNKFPTINSKVSKSSEKPFLLYYKGDVELLSNINKNVAVVGLTKPTEDTIKREESIVKELITNNIIVSGLALGCDSISHKVCVESGSKTIAILPCEITTVIPKNNTKLAQDILDNDGLLISEYLYPAKNSFDSVGRFIERDRLQAMFAKAIILISSYQKTDFLDENGKKFDSGSRHALEYAKQYGIKRYVMFNKETDIENPQFELNKDLLNDNCDIFTLKSIKEINELFLNSLVRRPTIKLESLF